MDIVNNATRSSSSSENDGKESSSPLHLPPVKTLDTSNRRRGRAIRLQKGNLQLGKVKREPKELESIPNVEKFQLRLVFMSEHMFTRQKSGIIISRLKGKIPAQEYTNTVTLLDNRRKEFTLVIEELVLSRYSEIESGFISVETLDAILSIFKIISLKEKNINQQNKLRQKIVASLAASNIHISSNDPHESIRHSLLALSVEDRAKVLAAIPI